MNKLKLSLTILFAIVIGVVGCQKEELIKEEVNDNNKETEVQNFIQFKDMQAFENILSGKDTTYMNTEDDFISMLDIFNQIETTKDEDEYNKLIQKHKEILIFDGEIPELIVEDDRLASVLTPDGIMQIGSQIFKIEHDVVKIIEDADISKISLLNQINNTENKITVYKIVRANNSKVSYSTWAYKSDDYKLRIKKYAINYGQFATVGGKLTHYEYIKRWGKWKWVQRSTKMSIWVSWSSIDARYWNGSFYVNEHTGARNISDTNKWKKTLREQRIPYAFTPSFKLSSFVVSGLIVRYWTRTGMSGTF